MNVEYDPRWGWPEIFDKNLSLYNKLFWSTFTEIECNISHTWFKYWCFLLPSKSYKAVSVSIPVIKGFSHHLPDVYYKSFSNNICCFWKAYSEIYRKIDELRKYYLFNYLFGLYEMIFFLVCLWINCFTSYPVLACTIYKCRISFLI